MFKSLRRVDIFSSRNFLFSVSDAELDLCF